MSYGNTENGFRRRHMMTQFHPDTPLLDTLSSTTDTENTVITRILLQEAFDRLPDRDRDMLIQEIQGHRQADIASQYGVTQSYVSRLVRAAKREIRKGVYYE